MASQQSSAGAVDIPCENDISLTKREDGLPKIGGSFGGFIALVVCLSLVIVISCTAVFFLIREPKHSEDEEHTNRRRYHQQQSIPSPSSPYTYTKSSDARKQRPMRLLSLFGFRGPSHAEIDPGSKINMERGGGHGWMQTGSGDEWGSDASDAGRPPLTLKTDSPSIGAVRQIPALGSPIPMYLSPQDTPFRAPPAAYPSSDSSSSVRFELQGIGRGMSFRDRHSPSPQSTLPSIHMQLSSVSPTSSSAPSPIPMASSTLPEHSINEESSVSRRGTMHSQISVLRTFEGGTKFIESL